MTEIKRFSFGSLPLRDVRVSEWRLPTVGFLLVSNLRTIMSKSSASTAQRLPKATTPVIHPKTAHSLAEKVLRVLDKPEYRGGKVVEYRDFSDGVIRINRDPDGRVHFLTPRSPKVSLRLYPNRSKNLLGRLNLGRLGLFLEQYPLVASYLDKDKLRGA